MKYNLVVCGGTFDHFHKGHREFLRHGLAISKKVLIGLTTDEYVKSKNKSGYIDGFKKRKQKLEKFLIEENAIDRVSIEPIDDIYLPKVWECLPIEAIIVSEDTVYGAKKVNLKRKEQKKSSLNIEVFPLIKSEDNGYISSSRIRNGEINIEGRPYVNPLWLKGSLLITERLRRKFKRPFGVLLRETRRLKRRERPYLITVGDITTKTFNDLGLNQDISVIDFRVARKKEFSSFAQLGFSSRIKVIDTKNPAGCLTPSIFSSVTAIFAHRKNERIILKIDGEEDLSVLPLVLAAPLGSIIFYGQPGKGVVKVKVTKRSKEISYNLVGQFIRAGIM